MVTKTYKNKVQEEGIESWALTVYQVSKFDFIFDTHSVHFSQLVSFAELLLKNTLSRISKEWN